MARVLLDLTWIVPPEQQAVVAGQLARLRATVAAQDFDPAERAALARLADQIETTARRRAPQASP